MFSSQLWFTALQSNKSLMNRREADGKDQAVKVALRNVLLLFQLLPGLQWTTHRYNSIRRCNSTHRLRSRNLFVPISTRPAMQSTRISLVPAPSAYQHHTFSGPTAPPSRTTTRALVHRRSTRGMKTARPFRLYQPFRMLHQTLS